MREKEKKKKKEKGKWVGQKGQLFNLKQSDML
jgi:hypothetical protein